MNIITENPTQTKKVAKILAQEILKKPSSKKPIVLGLSGDLGGGKTIFIQGLAKGLGIGQKITSPTFVIIRRYNISSRRYKNFYHIDCYRIGPKDLFSIGFMEIINNPKNIVAIEWADRITEILPKDVIKIKFKYIGPKEREIIINF